MPDNDFSNDVLSGLIEVIPENFELGEGVSHDERLAGFLSNRPGSFFTAQPSDGSDVPGIPLEIMERLMGMDVEKDFFRVPSTEEREIFGGHPGGISTREEDLLEGNLESHDTPAQTATPMDGISPSIQVSPINQPTTGVPFSPPARSTEALAFYRPFHKCPQTWGIYIYLHGIHAMRHEFQPWFRAERIPVADQIRIANAYLFYHELYHHKVESFALRMEAVLNVPCYLKGFNPRYQYLAQLGHVGTRDTRGNLITDWCYEESCAESWAREQVLKMDGVRGGAATKGKSKTARKCINDHFAACPPGYCIAAKTDRDWDDVDSGKRKQAQLVAVRSLMYEDYAQACLALLGLTHPVPVRTLDVARVAWGFGSKFDEPVGINELKGKKRSNGKDLTPRTYYLIR